MQWNMLQDTLLSNKYSHYYHMTKQRLWKKSLIG